MGSLDRMFSRSRRQPGRQIAAAEVFAAAADDDDEVIELEVVGESHRQEALEAIVGPKEFDGKSERVGVSLRCEADNQYDANAIRVEVMGQLVGYIERHLAGVLSPAIRRAFGGALEARGLIVGGWQRAADDAGHYGIRVWISERDGDRLGLRREQFDPSFRSAWPEAPPTAPDEDRLSPTETDIEAGRYGSAVTVTCEEYYQSTIAETMPAGWNPNRSWPLLVELVLVACNPHSKHPSPCIKVQVGVETIGYLTPKMSDRHTPRISACVDRGRRATTTAVASRGSKAGGELWRVKLNLRD